MAQKKMRDFALEVYFSKWEFAARYNLCASDCENMSLAELLRAALRRRLELAGPVSTAVPSIF